MPDLQLETLHAYTALANLRPDWPGRLILSVGLDLPGSATALAAIAAGAVILVCESDPVACHAALRSGACDFVVNTVDEAVRVVKNEIRQRKPLSVGVEGDPQAVLDELSERGVLPNLLLGATRDQERSASDAFLAGSLASACAAKGWRHHAFPFTSSPELRCFDARLQSLIPPSDERHRWVTSAPRLFPRDRTRHIFLTPAGLAEVTPGAP